MKISISSICVLLVFVVFEVQNGFAQKKDMPKEDVVEIPSIGEELCLHNLFQSNMVLQRDKPIPIWGWARPGEKVSVTIGDKSSDAIAGKDRKWKVQLPAMVANPKPQNLTVRGKNKTIHLDNVLIGCLLYTSPSPRDRTRSRMPSSA